MNKTALIFLGGFLFMSFFVLLFTFPMKKGMPEQDYIHSTESMEYQNGHHEGYQDAMDGMESLCATRRCKAQDLYERGYKLGYKKGIRDQKKKFKKNSDKEFVRPLTDSPGKTIGSDFNGDGIHDIIAGATGNDDGPGTNPGAAYIFLGATNISGTKDTNSGDEDVRILGKTGGDLLGQSVASVGDVNGDGIDDFIVGAYRNGEAASKAGAAYVFFGSTTLSGTISLGGAQSADVTVLGKAVDDDLGEVVSGVGDVNGDGFDDFIVAAPNNNDGGTDDEGAAYVFFGSRTISGTKSLGGAESADVTILGKGTNDQVGVGASGLGDVNGDGFDDFIVGARNNDDQAYRSGAAYVFFGASDISGTFDMGGGVQSANVTIIGKTEDSFMGGCATGGGDINGDGFDDILATSRLSSELTTYGGIAYVFFGASDLSGTKNLAQTASADVTITGKAANDNFGLSCSAAGDINDDGLDDMLMATQVYDGGPGGANAGVAYIFFGASDLSGTKNLGSGASADITVLGKAVGDYLGNSVSGAGDVNGDGVADFIVGTYKNDDGVGNLSGSAYVFFGASNLSGTKSLGTGASADVTMLGKEGYNYLGRSVGGGRDGPGP